MVRQGELKNRHGNEDNPGESRQAGCSPGLAGPFRWVGGAGKTCRPNFENSQIRKIRFFAPELLSRGPAVIAEADIRERGCVIPMPSASFVVALDKRGPTTCRSGLSLELTAAASKACLLARDVHHFSGCFQQRVYHETFHVFRRIEPHHSLHPRALPQAVCARQPPTSPSWSGFSIEPERALRQGTDHRSGGPGSMKSCAICNDLSERTLFEAWTQICITSQVLGRSCGSENHP